MKNVYKKTKLQFISYLIAKTQIFLFNFRNKKQRCLLSSQLFNITPEVNINTAKQKTKRNKGIQTRKEEIRLGTVKMSVLPYLI